VTARATLWVPGRIEVLGKHTDYAGGRSLVCAIERGFTTEVTPRGDAIVDVRDTHRNESCRTELDAGANAPRGSWGSYVAAVARRIARDFPRARRGADIAFSSSLPADAGLSSSSALVVSIALALMHANELEAFPEYVEAIQSRAQLAGYLGAVENGRPYGTFAGDEGVGTFGGSEDHTAILCCRAGELSQYSYAPVRPEGDVAIGDDVTFVIGVSGVTANKTGAALERYNALSAATTTVLEKWREVSGRSDATLAEAMASSPDAPDRLRARLTETQTGPTMPRGLRGRLEQFVEESHNIVPDAAHALRGGHYTSFGTLVDRSQHLAETCLGNQVPETVSLQRLAREQGALAASAFGAGFGGSVWALVRAAGADEFAANWAHRYHTLHSHVTRQSQFFTTRPGPAAHTME
jgi:galactokinase